MGTVHIIARFLMCRRVGTGLGRRMLAPIRGGGRKLEEEECIERGGLWINNGQRYSQPDIDQKNVESGGRPTVHNQEAIELCDHRTL